MSMLHGDQEDFDFDLDVGFTTLRLRSSLTWPFLAFCCCTASALAAASSACSFTIFRRLKVGCKGPLFLAAS